MDVHVRQGFSQENLNSQENGTIRIPGQQMLLSTMDVFLFAPNSFTDPLGAAVEFVDDNAAFEFGRKVLGKTGMVKKWAEKNYKIRWKWCEKNKGYVLYGHDLCSTKKEERI